MTKRSNPEAKLQISVKQYLGWCLPPSVEWTASLVGTNLSIRAADKARAMGVRKGWPDLQFLLPDGRVVFIELKSATGSLTPEQRAFRERCYASKADIWALCRSVDEVEAALRHWGVALKNHPFREREEALAPP